MIKRHLQLSIMEMSLIDLSNKERFHGDNFMFQLTKEEFENLKWKNFTSSWGGTRKQPYAFTEQGIYMLMTVLRGDLAIEQSRTLIRLFKSMKDDSTNKIQLRLYAACTT